MRRNEGCRFVVALVILVLHSVALYLCMFWKYTKHGVHTIWVYRSYHLLPCIYMGSVQSKRTEHTIFCQVETFFWMGITSAWEPPFHNILSFFVLIPLSIDVPSVTSCLLYLPSMPHVLPYANDDTQLYTVNCVISSETCVLFRT